MIRHTQLFRRQSTAFLENTRRTLTGCYGSQAAERDRPSSEPRPAEASGSNCRAAAALAAAVLVSIAQFAKEVIPLIRR